MSHSFDVGSSDYAAVRPSYPADLYRFLAAQCRKTGRAWDCACGNGQAALGLTEFFDEIHATDISPNQLEHAFMHPKIRYAVCPSERTPFADHAFDLVCVAQALHWLDFGLFWPEVTRVLKPGGVFAAWGYSWTAINAEVDRALEASLLKVIAPFWAEQNRLLWNGYREVTLPFRTVSVPEFVIKTRFFFDGVFRLPRYLVCDEARCGGPWGQFSQRGVPTASSCLGRPPRAERGKSRILLYLR